MEEREMNPTNRHPIPPKVNLDAQDYWFRCSALLIVLGLLIGLYAIWTTPATLHVQIDHPAPFNQPLFPTTSTTQTVCGSLSQGEWNYWLSEEDNWCESYTPSSAGEITIPHPAATPLAAH